MSEMARTKKKSDQRERAVWLRQLHRWHWISSAICLIGMLLFAITGITLNHASQIEARPRIALKEDRLPQALLTQLAVRPDGGKGPLPSDVREWLADRMSVGVGRHVAEWSDAEVYLSLPRPGGDAWLSIDLLDGTAMHEKTDRGWISYLNDLHKGRNTGEAWSWFIDVFAVACLAFCVTGLLLLRLHAGQRPATWPVVGLGLAVPLILAMLFVH